MSREHGELPLDIDRARRLFLFLRDLTELRTRTIRDFEDYERTTWFGDLPTDRRVWSVFHNASPDVDRDTWIELERVNVDRAPTVPDELSPWIVRSQVPRFDLDEPGLVDPEEHEAERPQTVDDLYRNYVNTQWLPWARTRRELEPAHRCYTELFSMSERRQALGEVFELVVGVGLLTWNRHGQRIRRHMITTPVEISVDSETGRIEVRSTETEGRNRVELDMLEIDDRGPTEAVSRLNAEVENADPLDLVNSSQRLLSEWMNVSRPDGEVETTLDRIAATNDLRVAIAPALILRPRGQRTLHELLDSIARQLEEVDELPENIRSLVSTDEPANGGSEAVTFEDPEVYFPLPANDEQRAIIDRMKRERGVLVQGPPGTGKSHTIANLISHLLAQGKRVLVTSHTERALRVLRDKLPDEIQPLCISLLGADRESIQDLEGAIGQISTRQSDWSGTASTARQTDLRGTLDRSRRSRAEALASLRQIREGDTHGTTVGRYQGTTMQIAQTLASERHQLGWIDDEITEPEPPLSDSEFTELVSLTWSLPLDADAISRVGLPDPDDLTSADDLEGLVREEARLESQRAEALTTFGIWLNALDGKSLEQIAAAADALAAHLSILDATQATDGWGPDSARDLADGRGGTWRALFNEVSTLHATISEAASTLDTTVVVPTEVTPLAARAGFRDLIAYVRDGGKLRTGLFASGAARGHRLLLEETRVDGSAPTEEQHLTQAESHLTIHIALQDLDRAWGSRLTIRDSESFAIQTAAFDQERASLGQILELEHTRDAANSALTAIIEMPALDWLDGAEVSRLLTALRAAQRYREADAVRAQIEAGRARLGAKAHPAIESLRDAIDERTVAAYRSSLEHLRELRDIAAKADRRRELQHHLASAPLLVRALQRDDETVWQDRASRFSTAWGWAYANHELERILDPDAPLRLAQEIDREERRERKALADLSAELSWARMFESLTNHQATALTAWTSAVRKIGKGTGKYAAQHRRTARAYMAEAREAIPAWIMPMYRVAESVSAQPEPFDVVIIDEASQSGVEALFLFYMAKQVIVVGDDEQIAPEAVGVNLQVVQRLQQQHLEGLPFMELFEPTTSLFDQANMRFRGGRIRLREHFRCMPEIIEFSNRLSYRDQPLIPMRQFGADRLSPIKTVHLPDGYREGGRQAINRPEAEEIVTRIQKILTDPRYDDATIGVVSLQGEHQARLIETRLIERIGPQVMTEREIVCGDAYAFQGDERDVMFLSLVAAPNTSIGSLSKIQDRRRFNVAASRAKDQVWLVHSSTLDDLSTTDVRRTLLEYYLKPEIEHLEELAEFDDSILNDPFDSRFEQDVYLQIRRRGFRVIPQVRVAGYRIDLVIEGGSTRLAVECDGDEWHGAEQWEADSARQRTLERTGWRFVRIRGSSFYRDPEAALEAVWKRCDELDITPGGASRLDRSTAVSPITTEAGHEVRADFSQSRPVQPDVLPRGEPGIWPQRATVEDQSSTGEAAGGTRDEDPTSSPATAPIEPLPHGFPSPSRSAGIAHDDPAPGGHIPHPKEAGPHSRAPSNTGLEPYIAWSGSGYPDPREARRLENADHLIEIIRTEGPVTADRAFSLFIRAAGFSRVTRQARSALNQGLFHLDGQVDINEFATPATNWPQRTLRVNGTPPVVVRELGPRDLYEVPLDEVAQLMRQLRVDQHAPDDEDLMRALLDRYARVRLGSSVKPYLAAALRLASTL